MDRGAEVAHGWSHPYICNWIGQMDGRDTLKLRPQLDHADLSKCNERNLFTDDKHTDTGIIKWTH